MTPPVQVILIDILGKFSVADSSTPAVLASATFCTAASLVPLTNHDISADADAAMIALKVKVIKDIANVTFALNIVIQSPFDSSFTSLDALPFNSVVITTVLV